MDKKDKQQATNNAHSNMINANAAEWVGPLAL